MCLSRGRLDRSAGLCTHAICNSTGVQICPSSTKNNAQLSRWCPNSATPAPARSRCHWLVSPTLPPKPCAQRRLSTCRILHLASLSPFFLLILLIRHYTPSSFFSLRWRTSLGLVDTAHTSCSDSIYADRLSHHLISPIRRGCPNRPDRLYEFRGVVSPSRASTIYILSLSIKERNFDLAILKPRFPKTNISPSIHINTAASWKTSPAKAGINSAAASHSPSRGRAPVYITVVDLTVRATLSISSEYLF